MTLKKNLVAAAALMAVAAAAQADVKLYGTLDYAVGSFEMAHTKNTSTRKTAVESGGMMTSYVGISGSEDLGGGLKAEFALESFLAGDTGATVKNLNGVNSGGNGFWGRASNIALSGGFGKVAVGQYDNPLFTSGYTYNPFGSSMTVSPTMLHTYMGGGAKTYAFDTGWVNSLTYESPIMTGLQGFLQYAPKETTATGTSNSYTAAAQYNAGPLSAMLTYAKVGRAGAATAYTADQKVTDLGVSYDFGAAKAFGQFTTIKDKTADDKATNYQVGVSVPVNAKATVMASYGAQKYTPSGNGAKITDKILSVGYDYALSKRTDVYGVFMTNSQTNKDSGQTLAVGVKHNF
ncbi:MAG: hypothetical protein RI907_3762 [Pseudomonadota bacterium]|jgi:predicted porin